MKTVDTGRHYCPTHRTITTRKGIGDDRLWCCVVAAAEEKGRGGMKEEAMKACIREAEDFKSEDWGSKACRGTVWNCVKRISAIEIATLPDKKEETR